MKIVLNGQAFEVAEGSTLGELIALRQAAGFLKTPVFAVERNKAVVAKKELGAVKLEAGDQVNVAVLVGGG